MQTVFLFVHVTYSLKYSSPSSIQMGPGKSMRCNLKKAVDRLQNKLSFIGKEMAAVPSQPNTTQNFSKYILYMSFFDITTSLILGFLVVGNWYLSKPGIC